jgi:hypothetical protein
LAQLAGLPLGCGPSIQPIHEGGVRFEHCYRLDLDARIAPAHRHACWKQWLEVYSYGQSRDRLEYSQRRLRDLEAGDPHPPQLNLDQQEAREARQFYMARGDRALGTRRHVRDGLPNRSRRVSDPLREARRRSGNGASSQR